MEVVGRILTKGRHFKRVVSYARPSDYVAGAVFGAGGPALMLTWERIAPSYVGKGGFAPIMRLTGVIGLGAGFLLFYQRSICGLPSSFLAFEEEFFFKTIHFNSN